MAKTHPPIRRGRPTVRSGSRHDAHGHPGATDGSPRCPVSARSIHVVGASIPCQGGRLAAAWTAPKPLGPLKGRSLCCGRGQEGTSRVRPRLGVRVVERVREMSEGSALPRPYRAHGAAPLSAPPRGGGATLGRGLGGRWRRACHALMSAEVYRVERVMLEQVASHGQDGRGTPP